MTLTPGTKLGPYKTTSAVLDTVHHLPAPSAA